MEAIIALEYWDDWLCALFDEKTLPRPLRELFAKNLVDNQVYNPDMLRESIQYDADFLNKMGIKNARIAGGIKV